MINLKAPRKEVTVIVGLVIFSAALLNFNLGYRPFKVIDLIFNALLFAFVLTARKPIRRVAWTLIFISAIYSVAANLYGKPSVMVISSLFQTNTGEALEFVKQITLYQVVISTLTMVLFFFLSRDRKIKNNKVSLVLVFLMISIAFIRYDKDEGVRLTLFNFFDKAWTSYSSYEENMAELNSDRKVPSDWKAVSTVPSGERKNLYIVIVGESMRRDYGSLYGYPIKNMPFLERVSGDFYSQYHSAAPNTFMSLPRSLAKTNKDGRIEINNNIVTLAKSLNMETYWFSNQGFLGSADTPVSKIAISSDHLFFLKKGGYGDNNSDDSELISPYEKILSEKKDNALVVFHLMGSHPKFCERLTRNDEIIPHRENEISCYLSTYLKTDKMIEKIYSLAQEQHYHFKIVYFSDHGLTRTLSSGELKLMHNSGFKQNYDVPLLVLSDDAKGRVYHDKPLSALNFMSFYAKFLDAHIESPMLYHFEDNTVFNGTQYIDRDTLADDPPII